MKAGNSQTEKLVKRNQSEKARRGTERSHIERISRLFRAPGRIWSKKDALGLGEMIFLVDECDWLLTKCVPAVLFLLYGHAAFPRGVVEVLPNPPAL